MSATLPHSATVEVPDDESTSGWAVGQLRGYPGDWWCWQQLVSYTLPPEGAGRARGAYGGHGVRMEAGRGDPVHVPVPTSTTTTSQHDKHSFGEAAPPATGLVGRPHPLSSGPPKDHPPPQIEKARWRSGISRLRRAGNVTVVSVALCSGARTVFIPKSETIQMHFYS